MLNTDLKNLSLEDAELIKNFNKTKKTSLNRLVILTEIKKRDLLAHIHQKNLVIFKLKTSVLPGFNDEPETYPLLLFYLTVFFLSMLGLNSQFKSQFLVTLFILVYLFGFRFLAWDLSHELLIMESKAVKIARLFRIFPLLKKSIPLDQSGLLVTTSLIRMRGEDYSARIFLCALQKGTKIISFTSEPKIIFLLSKLFNDYFDNPQRPVFVDQIPSGIPEMVNAKLQFLKYPFYNKLFRPPINTQSLKNFCLSIADLGDIETQKEKIDPYWFRLIQHVTKTERGHVRPANSNSGEKWDFLAEAKDSWLIQYPARLFIPKQNKYSRYSRLFSTFKMNFTLHGIVIFDSKDLYLDHVYYSDIKILPATSLETHLYLELNQQKFELKIDGSFPIKEIISWFKNVV